jgi:hypothetical protein
MTVIPPMPVQDVAREVLRHAQEQLPHVKLQNELSAQ